MRAALLLLAACAARSTWRVPDGWKKEVIPFPLDFAPSIAHQGNEELRFPPGFFDPASPARWSYAFVWRTKDAAQMAPDALAAELTTYFTGLVHAVHPEGPPPADGVPHLGSIPVHVEVATDYSIRAHLEDVFKTHEPIELTGRAERRACGDGAVWIFVLAPATSGIRPELEQLARAADCGQDLPK